MFSTPNRISENAFIDAIDAAIADYARRHRREPVNVSHWDPSPEFVIKLKTLVPVPSPIDPVPYRYSYLLSTKTDVLRKLGFTPGHVSGLFTENGSTSISAIANWLHCTGVEEVHLLSPSYFTTAYSLTRVGLRVNKVFLPRECNRYQWPTDIIARPGQAVWITNPVYNTGEYSIERSISDIVAMMDTGVVVVADETLALTPTTIAQALGGAQNFLGIYTPHKGVCINGQKFSIVAFHPSFKDFFDDWADILFGGLSISACAAIEHFLSKEFGNYQQAFFNLVEGARAWHTQLLASFKHRIVTDRSARGHFLTVYFPEIDASLGSSLSFIERTIETSGAAFIPGSRSGFDPALGFCFRVNLAQDGARFRGALNRLYHALAG